MKIAHLFCVALAIAIPGAAHAAEPSSGEQSGDRSNAAQAATDNAYQAYQSGDYVRAINLYLESYKLAPTAEALFNIASIYDKKLQDRKLAIEFYRRAASSPDASSDVISRSTTRLAAMNAPQDEPPPSSRPAAAPASSESHAPPENDDPGQTLRIAGYATAGVGVVGLAVGTIFGLSAKSKHSDATDAGCTGKTCPTASSASTERDAASAATVSTVGFVAGGALLAGGIALVLLAPKREASPTTALRLTPAVGPGSAGLTLSGILF